MDSNFPILPEDQHPLTNRCIKRVLKFFNNPELTNAIKEKIEEHKMVSYHSFINFIELALNAPLDSIEQIARVATDIGLRYPNIEHLQRLDQPAYKYIRRIELETTESDIYLPFCEIAPTTVFYLIIFAKNIHEVNLLTNLSTPYLLAS